MSTNRYSVIIGSGSYLPTQQVKNADFHQHEFYDDKGNRIEKEVSDITRKFEAITDIAERRYVEDNLVASDIAYEAALRAIENAQIDPESLDYLIVAHNFGDMRADNLRSDFVPTLASRVKFKLQIENPYCIAYDLPFGCPGWLQGVIQANYFLKSGDAKRALIIGAETLSRVCDPHDRDSLIYSDGAGATILEAVESDEPVGILSQKVRSDTIEQANLLYMDKSYNKDYSSDDLFLKMHGHKLYVHALRTVPALVKEAIDASGVPISEIKKVLIHQANAKMDDAILERVFQLYGITDIPEDVMPMTIRWLGNSSVATVPTLYDLVMRGKLEGHEINSGDHIVFASVGAGVNVNATVYKVP